MSDLNQFTCTGRLGAQPELKFTQSGKAVATISVAISGIKKEETTWIRATFWEKQAEILNQYCAKGDKVGLTGRLTENKWTDKDGNERKNIELQVGQLVLLQGKAERQAQTESDEIPF